MKSANTLPPPEAGRPEVYLHRMRVARARESGADIIDLGYADVRQGPPKQVMELINEKLRANPTVNLYGEVTGLWELREAVAQDLSRGSGTVRPENVIITAGANHGVVLAILAMTNAGQSLALPSPYFFNHVTQVQLLGREVKPIGTQAEGHYAVAPLAWNRAFGSLGVVTALISQPRNPTSTQMSDEDMRKLFDTARRRERTLIIDESYREFGKTPGQYPWTPDTGIIRVGSLSKSFCLAGWRVGYMVVPDEHLESVIRAQDALMIHPTIGSQIAARTALQARVSDDYVAELAVKTSQLRRLVAESLRALDWVADVFSNAGTFVWVHLHDQHRADAIADRLLTECGVAVLSGRAFGTPSEECLRIGVTCVSPDQLAIAIDRLNSWRP